MRIKETHREAETCGVAGYLKGERKPRTLVKKSRRSGVETANVRGYLRKGSRKTVKV